MPGAEADPIGSHQLDLLRVRLELERREREVVEKSRLCRYERPAVDGVGNQDVSDQKGEEDHGGVGHWNLPASKLSASLRRFGDAAGQSLLVAGEHEQQEAEAVEPAPHLRVVEAP